MNHDLISALTARAEAAKQQALLAGVGLNPAALLTLPLTSQPGAEIDCGAYTAAAAEASLASLICDDAGYAAAAATYSHWAVSGQAMIRVGGHSAPDWRTAFLRVGGHESVFDA